MPRVLRIINRFNIGGITYNVSYLSKYLEPEYQTLLVGGPEEKGEDSSLYIPQELGLRPIVLKQFQRSISLFADYKAYLEIKKLIKEFKPDIVHTHASKAGAIGRLAALHCKVPIIIHTFHGHVFHSYFGKFKTSFYKWVERYLAKRTTTIIAISNQQKHELADVFQIASPEKIEVIPLGFDLSRFTINKEQNRKEFRAKYSLEENEIAIGIVGRLAPIKNHSLFIESLSYIKNHGISHFKAFIIGDGETKSMIVDSCIQNHLTYSDNPEDRVDVVFTSWIKNIEWALHGLDIVALTSLNEGTPVSIIEAQAAGKTVVCTNVGGIKDILNSECGFIAEVNDKKSFFNYLLKACNDNKLDTERSARIEKWVLSKFSYQRLVSDMRRLYYQLLNK